MRKIFVRMWFSSSGVCGLILITVWSVSSFNISPTILHSALKPSIRQIPTLSSSSPRHSTLLKQTLDGIEEETDGELLNGWKYGRPLKVAIAGGGVGGLTTALAMLKRGFDVTVYERTEAFARFGGPIQFASNALSVIKSIDDVLFDRIMERFTFTGTRTCGIKVRRGVG